MRTILDEETRNLVHQVIRNVDHISDAIQIAENLVLAYIKGKSGDFSNSTLTSAVVAQIQHWENNHIDPSTEACKVDLKKVRSASLNGGSITYDDQAEQLKARVETTTSLCLLARLILDQATTGKMKIQVVG